MKSKLGFMMIVAGLFTVGGLARYTESEPVSVEINKVNEQEFEVVLQLDEGQEFTAYDIEVVGGKAVVSLMKEGKE